MLDSFYIKNFRLFKELKIKTLGRVNLITGKNNSGKSCFLEALRVYAANDSLKDLLHSLIEERDQLQFEISIISGSDITSMYRHLFYGYQFPKVGGEELEIGYLNHKENKVKLRSTNYSLSETENGKRLVRVDNALKEVNNFFTFPVLEIEQNSKIKPFFSLTEEAKEYVHPRMLEKISEKPKLNLQFIPTRRLNGKIINFLWDKANVKPNLRKEIFNAMRLIDQKIQEVVVTSDSTIILIYNDELQVPLKSLGDGTIRLFHIILALVNAKDGMLLIDEFENGLHYSVQPKIWDVIFKLAETLNTQVFATTHSRDCIRAFHEIWSKSENNDKGCFFRLDHYPEKDIIRPMFYDLEALGDSFDVNGEMR